MLLASNWNGAAMAAELVRMWQYLPEFLDYGRFRAVCGYLGGAPWPNDNARAVARLSDSNPCFLLVKNPGKVAL